MMKRIALLLVLLLCATLSAAADSCPIEAEGERQTLYIGPRAIHTETSPVWYGRVTLPEDGSLPATWEEALSLLDTTDWYVVHEASAPMYAEDGEIAGLLLCGAPVRVMAEDAARVRIVTAGNGLLGWVDRAALTPVAEKLALPKLAGPFAVDWHSPAAMTADGLALFGLCAEGCCGHVYEPATGAGTIVPVDELPATLALAAFIGLHAPEYIPGEMISTAYLGESTIMALVCQPGQHPWQGGSMRFLGAEKAEGAWRVTLSAPFPAGVTPYLDNYHAGEGGIVVYFQHPDLPEDPEEPWLTEAGFALSLRESRWLVDTVRQGEMSDAVFMEDNALYGSSGERFFGDFAFSRDVTWIDWRTFPLTMEAALSQTDMSQWAILHCDAMLMDIPVVGVSLGRCYYEGVWVRLVECSGDWWRVELPGGVTGYVPDDTLAVPDSYIHISQPPQVALRRGEPAIRLLDAPDGNLVRELDTRRYTVVRVLGESPDGRYLHILDEVKGYGAGYVLTEECTPYPSTED